LFGVPYWQGAIALAIVIAAVLFLMERWRPWRDDLGADVDGNRGSETAAETRKRMAPAE
jgi:hypothetical protein